MRMFLHCGYTTYAGFEYWLTFTIKVPKEPETWEVEFKDGSKKEVVGTFKEVVEHIRKQPDYDGYVAIGRTLATIRADSEDAAGHLPKVVDGTGIALVEVTEDENREWIRIVEDYQSLMKTWADMFTVAADRDRERSYYP